jgi:alanine-glyoxylate transaminase/serine-glyoxylate transaminase/serine-pyruvate transaminase
MASRTTRASSRLTQISKHLDSKPFFELNTPFSTERTSRPEDDSGRPLRTQKPREKKLEQQEKKPEVPKKMSNQAPHPALLIPGPIEFDDEVLNSMSHYRCDEPIDGLSRPCILTQAVNHMSANPL